MMMATATAIRPPPPSVAVSSSEHHHDDSAEEEHASSSNNATAATSAATIMDVNDGSSHSAEEEYVNKNLPSSNNNNATSVTTTTMDQETHHNMMQLGSHNLHLEATNKSATTTNGASNIEHQQEQEEVGLSLSSSRSSSPPFPNTKNNTMISSMATHVSEEALTAAVEAAAAAASSQTKKNDSTTTPIIMDASLLPRPLMRPQVPSLTNMQHHHQSSLQTEEEEEDANISAMVEHQGTTTATTTLSTSLSSTLLETKIMQMEQSLNTLTQLCQSLLLQQQQQQQQGGGTSRSGSEATGESITPPGNISPNTPYGQYNDDAGELSQWPPTHHHLLESPEVSMHQLITKQQFSSSAQQRQQRRRSSSGSTRKLSSKGKTMSMVLLDINPGESRGPSMIPFTTDLDACDEMDGDSVAGGCRDDLQRRQGGGGGSSSSGEALADNASSGRRSGLSRDSSREESGGSSSSSIDVSSRSYCGSGSLEKKSPLERDEIANCSSNESSYSSRSSSSSSRRKRRTPRRLSSSLKHESTNQALYHPRNETNLECQAYTTTHLEALRLRREAGKGRAYSFNDSLLQDGGSGGRAAAAKKGGGGDDNVAKNQWKPTLEVVDGGDSIQEPHSAISTDSFVYVPPREITTGESKEIDITMPDLSVPASKISHNDNEAADSAATNSSSAMSTNDVETKVPVGGSARANTAAAVENIIAHSTSCASNMSSDTTKTLKSGNSSARKQPKPRSGSIASSSSPSMKERSQSISSSKSGSSASAADAAGAASTTTNTATPAKRNKGKSPHKHSSQQQQQSKGKSSHKSSSSDQQSTTTISAVAAVAADNNNGNKNNQTMKEYVINDLLNIDSRNQDGSATEDIDANMEEFLRIPSKLEILMIFSLAVCIDSFLYAWAMLPLKFIWGWICLVCSGVSLGKGVRGIRFHRRHLYPLMQSVLIYFVYSQVLCPISIGKLYHWIRGQAMLKLYVLIAIVEVFDRLLCSFGQDAWDSLYWNTTKRPWHPRMFVSLIVVGIYVTIHSLFLFVHVATLSVAVNSADNALLTLLISGNFAEIKSTVFKKYNKQNLFKITTSDICERFKLALFLLLILFVNRFQGEMTKSMVQDYYSMCGIVFAAELISDWIKHSFITKFNLIKSTTYFDYALVISGDVTGIGHEGLNLDYTHAAMKRLGLAQIPLVCVTARYMHEAVRYVITFQGNGDVDHPVAALVELMADGNKWKFYTRLLQGMAALVLFKIALGMCIRYVARGYLGGASTSRVVKGAATSRKSSSNAKSTIDVKKKQ